MRLLGLLVRNFLVYEELELDLSDISQVAIVGANGAGKSALLDATLWSLFGYARGRPDELIRQGEQAMNVTTTWALDRDEVVITRTRDARGAGSSSLTLMVNGANRTRATIADTQERIEELVGLPLRALLSASVMVQGESDALMEAGPAERKELLARLFGLERYERLHDLAKTKAAEATGLADAAAGEIERLEMVIAQEMDFHRQRRGLVQRRSLLAEEIVVGEALRDNLRDRAATLRERAVQANELVGVRREANKRLDNNTAALARLDRDALIHHETMASRVPKFDEKELARIEERHLITRDLDDSVTKAKRLELVPCHGEGIYATCPLLVDAVRADGRKGRLKTKLAGLGGPIDEKTLKSSRAMLLDRQRHAVAYAERSRTSAAWLEKLPAERSRLEAEIDSDRKAVQTAQKRLLRLAQEHEQAAQAAQDLQEAVANLSLARKQAEELTGALARVETQIGQIDESKGKIAALRDEFATYSERVAVMRILQRAFGRDGIPTLVLENGLPEIEDRANEILAQLPGGFRVTLVTQRELKSGAVRETLDVVVAAGGHERSYWMFSGGERMRIDFALRIALATMIAHRIGRAFETLWLDEGWGSQDKEGREAMLQVISGKADDFGLIVVVSHVDEVTDRFPVRILVESDGADTSTARVVAA